MQERTREKGPFRGVMFQPTIRRLPHTTWECSSSRHAKHANTASKDDPFKNDTLLSEAKSIEDLLVALCILILEVLQEALAL